MEFDNRPETVHPPSKPEIAFEQPEIMASYGTTLFADVPKENHERIQAGILLTVANLHSLVKSDQTTAVHYLGLDNFALSRSFEASPVRKKRLIKMFAPFSGTDGNILPRTVVNMQNELIADLQRADGRLKEAFKNKASYLMDFLNFYGRGMLACTASKRTSEWLAGNIQTSANRVFDGTETPQKAFRKTILALSRVQKRRTA